MAPVVPFIPLIAAGVGAAGMIGSSIISSKAQKNSAQISADATKMTQVPLVKDPAKTDSKPKKPILPGTGVLGDVTNPTLNRNKLLGN